MPQTLKAKAKRMLSARFGHPDFKKGQWQPIESVLGGSDALVVMPTGSGKSIVYQLPALMLPGLTVVVSPLIALMKDQQDKLAAHGVDALAMHSHLSDAEARELADDVEEGRARFCTSRPSGSRIASFSSGFSRER
jgi:ATP-dependent DNA helicase RecQ